MASTSSGPWSISEDSLRRYVSYASESCVQELLAASDPRHEGWKVLAVEGDAVISKRSSNSLHVIRSRSLLQSISPQQFVAVADAIHAARLRLKSEEELLGHLNLCEHELVYQHLQWDNDLVESEYIKELDDGIGILRLRFGEASKSPFRKREFIVYERRETMDDGTLVVAVASLPKEIAAGLHPKRSNSIRGSLLQSGWVIEKLEDDSCMVTYVLQLDPAGWLPKFFVNRFNMKLVRIMDNLKKLAQSLPNNG